MDVDAKDAYSKQDLKLDSPLIAFKEEKLILAYIIHSLQD